MFFKTSNPAALLAWDQFMADCLKLREEARHLDKVLGCGCRSVFSTGIGGRYFHGVNFPGNERPFSRELWTVQRPASGNSCRPRTSRIPVHLREQAKELAKIWQENIPVTYVLFPDEGHGFAKPTNKIAFNAVTEGFHAKCLGGRAEPIGDTVRNSTAQVPEGAEYSPGLAEAIKRD